jgi:starch synthase
MRVAFVTSELHPFSKTGGLADVSQALPAALAALGIEVTVFSPYYRSAADTCARLGVDPRESAGPVLWIGDQRRAVRYRTLMRDGCRLVFVVDDALYSRPTLYVAPNGADYSDNVARFAYLCRAALEYWLAHGDPPEVFHANDWQTGLIPAYLKTIYRPLLPSARSVFTIHNLAYQGMWPASFLYATGLDWTVFNVDGLEYYAHVNLMKSGISYADAITTVSPSYAQEIQTPALGRGLDGVLRAHQGKLRGILNGIDSERWNPATDPLLPARYDATDLGGKAVCKRSLQQRMRLRDDPTTLLFGVISRFDVQKGIPLIADAMQVLAPLRWQLAVLGSGDPAIEQRMGALAAAFPGRIGLTLGFDEPLAHLIEAGADAFLMPSAYEPCGLNQMYSQRYGTIPIVHATGGLGDTVVDASPDQLAAGTASGFTFGQFDAGHLAEAMLRAWRLYTDAPADWRRLQVSCMALDHSWARSARAYLDLYRALTTEP